MHILGVGPCTCSLSSAANQNRRNYEAHEGVSTCRGFVYSYGSASMGGGMTAYVDAF